MALQSSIGDEVHRWSGLGNRGEVEGRAAGARKMTERGRDRRRTDLSGVSRKQTEAIARVFLKHRECRSVRARRERRRATYVESSSRKRQHTTSQKRTIGRLISEYMNREKSMLILALTYYNR